VGGAVKITAGGANLPSCGSCLWFFVCNGRNKKMFLHVLGVMFSKRPFTDIGRNRNLDN